MKLVQLAEKIETTYSKAKVYEHVMLNFLGHF